MVVLLGSRLVIVMFMVPILHWFGFWFVFDCGFLGYIIVLIICLVVMSYGWWLFGCVYCACLRSLVYCCFIRACGVFVVCSVLVYFVIEHGFSFLVVGSCVVCCGYCGCFLSVLIGLFA